MTREPVTDSQTNSKTDSPVNLAKPVAPAWDHRRVLPQDEMRDGAYGTTNAQRDA